jgi:hypothetical protein
MGRRAEKIMGRAFVSWWLILLIGFGLAGNGFMLFRAIQAGNVIATIMFTIFFGGACVYLYRTYNARDELRGIWKG